MSVSLKDALIVYAQVASSSLVICLVGHFLFNRNQGKKLFEQTALAAIASITWPISIPAMILLEGYKIVTGNTVAYSVSWTVTSRKN